MSLDTAAVGLHVFDVLALLLVPPLLLGIINRTKARFAGRAGAPLLQPYWDLFRLLRKQMVVSRTTTWIFRAAPLITLAATLLAGLILPLGPGAGIVQFEGDFVLFAYLFGLSRFATTAAALDTGSPFEGMGASREATFACLAEPAVFFAMLTLSRISGSLSLGPMTSIPLGVATASLILCVVGLFIVLLAECSRVPFDDPNTHLELTMIHEVMVLDHSGPLLGVISYGAAMKLFVLSALVMRLLVPATESPWLGRAAVLAAICALAVLIGTVESLMARARMQRIPNFLGGAILLTALSFALAVR
jgi:formate hydrogenlyase subunit 4